MATFDGGPGADTYIAADEGTERESNTLTGAEGDDTLVGGLRNDTIDGGADDDSLVGGRGRDFLEGREGDDFMDAGQGDDVIRALGGDDTAIGGAGDDIIDFGGGNQVIDAGSGDDLIRWQFFLPGFTFKIDGGDGDDTLLASGGADRFDAGDGRDMVDYSDGHAASRIDLANGIFKGGAAGDRLIGVEDIIGSMFGDTIIGTDAANALDGFVGADSLFGGLGADLITGGFGSDRIDGGAADASGPDTLIGDGDIVDSEPEFDTLVLASATFAVTVDLKAGSVNGGVWAVISGFEKVEGSDFGDIIRGSDDSTKDGADTLEGLGGDDRLVGRDGDDMLLGGEGDDKLEGGLGRDTLSGRAGRDIYIYNSVAESSAEPGQSDLIVDFRHDEGDRIDLRLVDADATMDGRQKFHFVGDGPFEAAGDLRFERTGRGLVLYGDTDGDGAEDFVIQIGNAPSIERGDFIL